jgi:hypothetical protein
MVDTKGMLDFAEEKQVYVYNDTLKEPELSKRFKAVYNVTKDHVSAIVGLNYNIVQHRDLYKCAVEACSNLGLEFKDNVLDFGDKVYIDIDFPEKKFEFKQLGESFAIGLRFMNSYNKKTGVVIVPKFIRLACMNGMIVRNLRWSHAVKIRHNTPQAKDFETHVEIALSKIITMDEQLRKVVEPAMADSIEFDLAKKIYQYLLGRCADEYVEKIWKIAKKNMPRTAKSLSRWDMYNAVTQFVTHGAQLKPSVYDFYVNKYNKLLTTPLTELIAEVREAEAEKE